MVNRSYKDMALGCIETATWDELVKYANWVGGFDLFLRKHGMPRRDNPLDWIFKVPEPKAVRLIGLTQKWIIDNVDDWGSFCLDFEIEDW